MKTMFRTIALAAIASLAFTGCIKHEPMPRPNPHGENNGRDQENEHYISNDWPIRYLGRISESDENGKVVVKERFKFTYSGVKYLFPLVISPDDFKNLYDNNVAAFFKYELGILQNDAKEYSEKQLKEEKVLRDLGVYLPSTSDVVFSLHMHGTWLIFLVELNKDLTPTYKYAENSFTIEEEPKTEAFKRWEGWYHVSDAYCGFDIEVVSAEANYLYYVYGWETGPSIPQASQMNMEQDWLYARFEDGQLRFFAQNVSQDEYDGMTVDEVFAGTYLTSNSDEIGELDWEGVSFEDNVAFLAEEDNKLMLKPWSITFDNGYTMTYKTIRYSRLWFTDNGGTVNWAFYNTSGVPSLPAEVARIAGTRSTDAAPVVKRSSKESVHRDQLKPVQTSQPRKWKKN